ncbi:MAG: alpha/beta fold hydrolase [Candidatus Lokiarchaeota archaeon]|nr:alpha/beta fold hydrolase [Candidatus Lokiarchaeota archaeon]
MESEVSFVNGTINLAGTLTIPNTSVEKFPAFVFVHGSGPNDRDENPDLSLMSPNDKEKLIQTLKSFNLEVSQFKLNVFNEMSDYLVKKGFAVLRYDKRGIGKSEGDYSTAGFKDLISDAHAAIKFLRSKPEINPSKIIVLGHSEGGIIGPVLCVEDPTIAALVICAGTSQKLDDIMLQQAKYTREMLKRLTQEQKEKLGVKDTPDPVEVIEKLIEKVKHGDEYVEVGGHKVYAKWFREHFAHDPLETIKQVKCPVLIVQGEKDFQVPFSNALALRDALEKSGNNNVRLMLFPNIDHLLKFEPGQSSQLKYISKMNREVEPLILKSIAGWTESVLVKNGSMH